MAGNIVAKRHRRKERIMSKVHDLTGKKFGRLTGIECIGSDHNKHRLWRMKCECGNETIVPATLVANGKVRSCGCLRAETTAHTTRRRAENAIRRREAWADGMVDERHAKFYAEGYVYIVSDIGEIYGPSGKLAQSCDKKGYVRFKQKSVHRLVALNFVHGYFDGAEVDHINAVRHDNRKDNLRWVTPAQNKLYARDSIIASNKRRAKNNDMQANQR